MPPISAINVEQAFVSPSLVVPCHPFPPFAEYSFSSSHRRVTPMPAQNGGLQTFTTPTSSVDLLLSVPTKDDESVPRIPTSTSSGGHLADADAATEPVHCHRDAVSFVKGTRFLQTTFFFPSIVYRMIEDVCKESGQDLMHWNDAGDKFWINRDSPQLGAVLKRYFKRTCRCLHRIGDYRYLLFVVYNLLTLSFV